VEEPTITRSKNGAAGPELIVVFDVEGIVHSELVPPDTTINYDFYCHVLRCLRESVRRKRPEFWRDHNWLLHHDNAPAHTPLKTTEFVTNNNMVIVLRPLCSSDLATCDFSLFPKLKMKLKGRRFETVSDIQGIRKRYSTAFRKITSTVLLKRGKNDGIVVYVLQETILKEMETKIE
jgi:hypothetical protein